MTDKRSIVDIPAQSGGAVEVRAGQTIKLIDVDGEQVADVFACSAARRDEWLSTGHTRTRTRRLFPRVGDAFYTRLYRPILTFVEDTSPGAHDMLYPSCEPAMYRRMGADENHPNCRDNFMRAAKALDWAPDVVPDPVNFFQNTPVNAAGELEVKTALSRPGDSVTLRAEMDLVFVATACAQDLAPINGARCTGLRLEIGDPGDLGPNSVGGAGHD